MDAVSKKQFFWLEKPTSTSAGEGEIDFPFGLSSHEDSGNIGVFRFVNGGKIDKGATKIFRLDDYMFRVFVATIEGFIERAMLCSLCTDDSLHTKLKQQGAKSLSLKDDEKLAFPLGEFGNKDFRERLTKTLRNLSVEHIKEFLQIPSRVFNFKPLRYDVYKGRWIMRPSVNGSKAVDDVWYKGAYSPNALASANNIFSLRDVNNIIPLSSIADSLIGEENYFQDHHDLSTAKLDFETVGERNAFSTDLTRLIDTYFSIGNVKPVHNIGIECHGFDGLGVFNPRNGVKDYAEACGSIGLSLSSDPPEFYPRFKLLNYCGKVARGEVRDVSPLRMSIFDIFSVETFLRTIGIWGAQILHDTYMAQNGEEKYRLKYQNKIIERTVTAQVNFTDAASTSSSPSMEVIYNDAAADWGVETPSDNIARCDYSESEEYNHSQRLDRWLSLSTLHENNAEQLNALVGKQIAEESTVDITEEMKLSDGTRIAAGNYSVIHVNARELDAYLFSRDGLGAVPYKFSSAMFYSSATFTARTPDLDKGAGVQSIDEILDYPCQFAIDNGFVDNEYFAYSLSRYDVTKDNPQIAALQHGMVIQSSSEPGHEMVSRKKAIEDACNSCLSGLIPFTQNLSIYYIADPDEIKRRINLFKYCNGTLESVQAYAEGLFFDSDTFFDQNYIDLLKNNATGTRIQTGGNAVRFENTAAYFSQAHKLKEDEDGQYFLSSYSDFDFYPPRNFSLDGNANHSTKMETPLIVLSHRWNWKGVQMKKNADTE